MILNVLPVLSRLSKLFQRQCIDFAAISDGVEAAISALEGFKANSGPRLASFLSEITEEASDYFYFHDQRISAGLAQRRLFLSSKENSLTN